jgi:3-isopropylmalate dehydrogenase
MSAAHQIAVIPGDGIGPEVVAAEIEVLEATGVPFQFSTYPAGDDCLAATGVALPDETLAAAKAARAVVFGAAGKCAAEVILRLRSELDCFANLRPSRAYQGVDCLQPETDLMIVRENTECLYIGREVEDGPGRVVASRLITEAASRRIARYAFEYARDNGRGKVTTAHKVNVLKKSEALWLEACRWAAAQFPEIEYEEALVDSLAMRLIMDPTEFQVVVTTNMFGDIISDMAAGLIGGLGLCPSANLGADHALFEPVHGTAPDIAGTGRANPAAAILCGAMLLDYLNEREAAEGVRRALESCLAQGATTPDLGGDLTTRGMARAVIDRMG